MVKPTVHELCYHPCGAVDLAAQEDWNDQASSTAYPACARLEVAPLLLCWLIIPTHWGRLCLLNICSQSTQLLKHSGGMEGSGSAAQGLCTFSEHSKAPQMVSGVIMDPFSHWLSIKKPTAPGNQSLCNSHVISCEVFGHILLHYMEALLSSMCHQAKVTIMLLRLESRPSGKPILEHIHYLPPHASLHSNKEVYGREKQLDGAAELILKKPPLLLHDIISTQSFFNY